MKLTRLSFLVFSLGLAPSACLVATTEELNADANVTDIPQSPVTLLGEIGTCWVHAALGMVESLVRIENRSSTLVLSKAYMSYWHWYTLLKPGSGISLAAPDFTQLICKQKRIVDEGGWTMLAIELIRDYGMIEINKFIPDESSGPAGLEAIRDRFNQELAPGGKLFKIVDRNPENIRKVLNDAFRLDQKTIDKMGQLFPTNSTPQKEFETSSDAFISYKDLMVGSPSAGNGSHKKVALEEVLARYSETKVPSVTTKTDRRNYLRGVMLALFDGYPLILSFGLNYDYAAKSTFQLSNYALPSKNGIPNDEVNKELPKDGHHAVIIDDVEIKIPGHGILKAGVVAQDEKLRNLALQEGEIVFFRVKNSWGDDPAPGALKTNENLRGYWDIYMDYLSLKPTKEETVSKSASSEKASCEGSPARGPMFNTISIPKEYVPGAKEEGVSPLTAKLLFSICHGPGKGPCILSLPRDDGQTGVVQ